MIPGQQHPRDMRLDHLHGRNGRRVTARIAQRRDECLLVRKFALPIVHRLHSGGNTMVGATRVPMRYGAAIRLGSSNSDLMSTLRISG